MPETAGIFKIDQGDFTMNERTMKLRLGAAVVLSLVIILIFLTFLGSREKLSTTSYEIRIQMVDAPNVMANTPIYQSGILIGRVSKVELTETKGVIVTARIYDDHKLYHDQECHLVSSLLGDASLRMITRQTEETDQTRHTEIKPGELIQGKTTLDPALLMAQMQETLADTISDVTTASVELSRVAETTNGILTENRENVSDIMKNARSITGNTARIMTSWALIMDDNFCKNLQNSVENLSEAAVKFPKTIDKVNETLDGVQETIQLSNTTISGMAENFSGLAGKLENSLGNIDKMMVNANATLANVRKLSMVFSDEKQMEVWASNFTNTLRNLEIFTETLNQEDSTLGLLLHDRLLYDRLQNTLEKVNELPRQLEPILFNAQVMSEKLARHPELLGLRGYLKPDSGASGTIPWPKGVRPSISNYSPSGWNSAPYSTPLQYQRPAPASGNWGSLNSSGSGTVLIPQADDSVSRSSDDPIAPGIVKADGGVGVKYSVGRSDTLARRSGQGMENGSSETAGTFVLDPVPVNAGELKRAEGIPALENAETRPVLKPAETELAGKENAGASSLSHGVPQNVQIPEDARLITPAMVGMTPEEFQNADPAFLSEAIWNAVAVSDKNAVVSRNETDAQNQDAQIAAISEEKEDPEMGGAVAELSVSKLPSAEARSQELESELLPEPLAAPVNPASGNRPVVEQAAGPAVE